MPCTVKSLLPNKCTTGLNETACLVAQLSVHGLTVLKQKYQSTKVAPLVFSPCL